MSDKIDRALDEPIHPPTPQQIADARRTLTRLAGTDLEALHDVLAKVGIACL